MSTIDMDWVHDLIGRYSDHIEGNTCTFHNGAYARMAKEIAATVDEESEMHICKRCGVAYELNILDKGFGKPRFCPNCGYREMYQ